MTIFVPTTFHYPDMDKDMKNKMEQRYTFSGHESFPCKTLWLKKGYDFVVQGKDFNSPEAVIELGGGKNMVASIRFWLRVFGICENDQPTWLGNYFFNETGGKDKYLEDLATLWLLHFHLVFRAEATLYNWFFTDFQKDRRVRQERCLFFRHGDKSRHGCAHPDL